MIIKCSALCGYVEIPPGSAGFYIRNMGLHMGRHKPILTRVSRRSCGKIAVVGAKKSKKLAWAPRVDPA